MWWGEGLPGHHAFERQAKKVNDCPVFALEFADAFDEENGVRFWSRTLIGCYFTRQLKPPTLPFSGIFL
jgi:hypothetical protein